MPACLLFNESPHVDWVAAAIEQGFSLVMFTDDALDNAASLATIGRLVALAPAQGAAVEGELASLPGVGGDVDPLTESDFI